MNELKPLIGLLRKDYLVARIEITIKRVHVTDGHYRELIK